MMLRLLVFVSVAAATPLAMVLAQPPMVAVFDAWIRATAPHQDEAAAYMILLSPSEDRLTGVASPAAAMAMLHTTAHDNEVMRMREVESLALPAGKPVTLSPGGTHLMLAGLPQPLRAGEVVTLSLRFQHSPPVEVRAKVLPISAQGPDREPAP